AKEAFIRSGARSSIEDWLADGLLQALKVDSSQSSVIQLRYLARDPKFAADVANTFAESYVDTTLKLRIDPAKDAAAWFDEQLKGLRQQLEEAQGKLNEFQREHGIIATDERLDIENARLTELSNQVLRAQDTAVDSSTKLGQARRRSSDTIPEVLASPLVQSLKGELLRAEAKLQEMATRLGPNHPDYVQQQTQVAALRDRLN